MTMSSNFVATLERFRRRQADQFTQLATIERPVGEATTVGLTVTQPTVTVGTDRPCKLTTADAGGAQHVTAGETEVLIVGDLIKFAPGEDVRQGDVITITASEYNARDVGRHYRAEKIDRREWQIATRVTVVEILAPLANDDEMGS